MRQIEYAATALLFILIALVGYSLSQICSPANNSEGMIIPNTDLPTAGKKSYDNQEKNEKCEVKHLPIITLVHLLVCLYFTLFCS